MESLLFEQPWMVGAMGSVAIGIALCVWIQLGVKQGLYAAAGLLILTAALVMINLQVVTDREQITKTLHEVAALLRANDREGVFRYIHPNAVAAVMQAKSELPKYKFSDARVTQIREIEVNPDTPPPTAVATFMVVVDVNVSSQIDYRGPRLIRVFFMKRDDQWLVRDYQHTDPMSKSFDATDYSDLVIPPR